MSAAPGGRRGRAVEHEEEEHENEERWLVSFADMMTLLFCLFMVLFAISSVNTSKYESLKESLEQSFNAKLMSGGDTPLTPGSSSAAETPSPIPSLTPTQAVSQSFDASKADARAEAAREEQESFVELKRRIDAEAKRLGLETKVRTEIRDRGLVVQLLTDGVLFDSGRADLKASAEPLLVPLGKLIRTEGSHPVIVEGYTDAVPVRGGQFPTNWELSGARAARVVRHFINDGVPIGRLSAAQFAQQHPIASNATPEGRSRNRRVEVVLARQNPVSTQGGKTP